MMFVHAFARPSLRRMQRPAQMQRLWKSSGKDDWIPPQKPLAGDTAGSHIYTHIEEAEVLKQLESDEKKIEQPDWLQTRRQTMQESTNTTLNKMDLEDIPNKLHTLLSPNELSLISRVMGGENIQLVLDVLGRMGGMPHGIIVVTAEQHTQRRAIAETIVDQLRRRQLHEAGVVGAEFGVDGNKGDPNEGWLIVDCHNFVVHIQNKETREAINLEALWSGNDDMYRIDLSDEDAIDTYVGENPVPANYNMSLRGEFEMSMKQLETKQWVSSSTKQHLMAQMHQQRLAVVAVIGHVFVGLARATYHLRTQLYVDFCHTLGSTYETAVHECYNGASLFSNEDWGELDILDAVSLNEEGELVLRRTFYASNTSICDDEVDSYTLPIDECVGPFGKPHPWGRFSLVKTMFDDGLMNKVVT